MRTSGTPGALAILLTVACVLADAGAARASLEVVGPLDVEHRFVSRYGTTAWLVVDDRQWELITDPESPLVSSLGDGSFHPMSVTQVREALRDLGPIPDRFHGRVLVLPYPRRTTLRSSCEDGTIFLSPGIREVATEHVHATVAHEVGHLLQRQLAPEGSGAWSDYLALRGLDDPRYHPEAEHRNRPREIFAEDFRFLFGGDLATTAGTIENPDLALPTVVPGLAVWFDDLLHAPWPALLEEAAPPPTVQPNPHRTANGPVRVRFHAIPGGGAPRADVYDACGRLVQTLTRATELPDGVEFIWNGRDRRAHRVASGVYFVRWREHATAGTARVRILR